MLSYSPFVTEGHVSLPGCDDWVPIKSLHNTGVMDSLILESVLSQLSYTGDCMLIQGIRLNTLSVPLHKVNLNSDLVQSEVVLGVYPALPVDRVHIILGNTFVGECVWANLPSPILSIPQSRPDIESHCEVMCTMSLSAQAKSSELGDDQKGNLKSLSVPGLSNLPFPFDLGDLSEGPRKDLC